MANWITHTMIVDTLLHKGLSLDRKGFCIGNIAPDCNVENADWTAFTPPREITHWMRGESKLTADYEGFYSEHILDKPSLSPEHHAFLLGYYAHLIVDVAYQRFVRDDQRVRNIFARIEANRHMRERLEGYPKNFDTLKTVFGRKAILQDIEILENHYAASHPDASYNAVLRKTRACKDYLDFLPKGAIARKISIMACEPRDVDSIESTEFYFFSPEEHEAFVNATSDAVYALLAEK